MLVPLEGTRVVQHVLVVDDEADICRLVQAALERGGAYRVTIALSGTEALPLLEEPQPDLLIADVVLPGMSGIELAEVAVARRIPVLLATDNADTVRALRNGGWALLRKPFRPATLPQDVAAALREAEAERQRASDSLAQLAAERRAFEPAPRRPREPRTADNDAQLRSLLEEDSDTVRAAFHMIENFGERAASVADQRARTASADDVAQRWIQVARAIRKLRPKL
jgi:DNA-binding response OmpR family regulator